LAEEGWAVSTMRWAVSVAPFAVMICSSAGGDEELRGEVRGKMTERNAPNEELG